MKTTLALIGAAFAAASPTLDLTIEHGVEEGTTVEKSISHSLSMELVSGVMAMGDMEQEMPDDFAMNLEHTLTLTVTDTYGESDGGSPKSVTRTITDYSDVLDGEVTEPFSDPEEVDVELEIELVDEVVEWTRGDDGYSAALADEESDLDEDLLEGLVFDLDGLALLPEAGADLSEGWTIPAEALGHLLSLGGDCGGTTVEEPDDLGDCLLRGLMLAPMLGELEGEVALALDEYDEESGLATLTIEGEVTSEVELLDYIEHIVGDADITDLDALQSADAETEITIEGTIVWNVAGKHLSRFDIDGDVSRVLFIEGHEADMNMDMEMTLEFAGEASWELEFEGAGE